MNKKHPSLKSVIRAFDADGERIVRVPVRNATRYALLNDHVRTRPGCAELYEEDYERITLELGSARRWRLATIREGDRLYHYVRVSRCGDNANRQVAQLVARPPRGTGICYRDGNPLNLRRKNLVIGKGRSKADYRTPLPNEWWWYCDEQTIRSYVAALAEEDELIGACTR